MKDDKLDGIFKEYSNGELITEKEYKDGLKSGSYSHIFYIGEEDEYKLTETGSYVDDKKDGTWKLAVNDEEGDRVLSIDNFEKGIKHGKAQNFQGDSLIFCNYYKGRLDGEYLIYRDFAKFLVGGIINTDTTKLVLITKGFYSVGDRSKKWHYYSISNTLLSTGDYLSDKKHGEWKYYYNKYVDENGESLEYSQKLYLIENYKYGKKDGKSMRFSSLESVNIPCRGIVETGDSCFIYELKEYRETVYFINDKIDGAVEMIDANNQLVYKGEIRNSKKNGFWIEKIDENTYEEGKYVNGERQGDWDIKINSERVYSLKYTNNEVVESRKYINQKNLFEHYKYKGEANTYYAKYSGSDINKKLEEVKIITRNYSYVIAELSLYYSDTLEVNTYRVKSKDIIKTSECLVGQKDGVSKLIVNNILLVNGKYDKDKKVGKWEYYYPSQNVLIKLEFNFDKPLIATERYYLMDSNNAFEGDFILYDKDGKVVEERSVKEGMRDGKTIYFDKSGEKIKKEKYKDGILQ